MNSILYFVFSWADFLIAMLQEQSLK